LATKHALFLQALDRYREIQSRRVFEILDRPGSVRRMSDFFSKKRLNARCQRRAVVVVSSGMPRQKLAGRCKETAIRTCKSMASAEKTFQRALMRGTEQGEFRIHDTRAVARFFYCVLQGLVLTAKASRDRKLLNDVVKVTLSVLD
jgi:TetR/AcrR family transcriptional repressor of nem operon